MRTPERKKPAGIPKRAGDAQSGRCVAGKKTDKEVAVMIRESRSWKKGQSMTGKETAVKGGSPRIHNTASI